MLKCNVTTVFGDIHVGKIQSETIDECSLVFKEQLAAGNFRLPDGTTVTPGMDATDTPLWFHEEAEA